MSRAPSSLLLGSAVAFALCSAAAGVGLFESFDRWALWASQRADSGMLDTLGGFYSFARSLEVIGVALVSLLAVLAFGGRRRLATRLLAVFVATGIVELTMKFFLPTPPLPDTAPRRDRPHTSRSARTPVPLS